METPRLRDLYSAAPETSSTPSITSRPLSGLIEHRLIAEGQRPYAHCAVARSGGDSRECHVRVMSACHVRVMSHAQLRELVVLFAISSALTLAVFFLALLLLPFETFTPVPFPRFPGFF